MLLLLTTRQFAFGIPLANAAILHICCLLILLYHNRCIALCCLFCLFEQCTFSLINSFLIHTLLLTLPPLTFLTSYSLTQASISAHTVFLDDMSKTDFPAAQFTEHGSPVKVSVHATCSHVHFHSLELTQVTIHCSHEPNPHITSLLSVVIV